MKPVNNFIDSFLPTFGNHRENIPIYNDAQKMFISSSYTSSAGHLYYKGIRFSDRLVMIEQVGLYHNWTYIDGIELYSFNGTERVLIAKKQFDKEFYNMDTIKNEVKTMLNSFFKSQMLMSNKNVSDSMIDEQTVHTINSMYENTIEQIVAHLKQPSMKALLSSNN